MNQVSIIIPVHNTPEEYLRECLHSVLRQDYTNWEAILIDDGSTSGAERICDEYAAKDARFCVIHQRQSGVSAARNAGMAAANGDWLIFLDSDDWWEDNLLSSAMKSWRKNRRICWCLISKRFRSRKRTRQHRPQKRSGTQAPP